MIVYQGSLTAGKSREYLVILLVTILSGSLFSVVKIALQSFTPWQLILVRFCPTIPVFAWICWRGRQKFRLLNATDWLKLLTAGLFSTLLHNLAMNTGQTHVGAGIASLLDALNPPAILLLAVFFRGERVGRFFLIGSATAFLGVVVLTLSRQGLGIDQTTATGIMFLLCGPFTWATYTVLLADLIPKLGVATAPAAAVLSGTLLLLPSLPASFPDGLPHGWTPWLCAASLALLSTVTVQILWSWLLKHRGAARTGIIEYLNVIWGLSLAIFALSETLTWQMLSGAILILTGVAITRYR